MNKCKITDMNLSLYGDWCVIDVLSVKDIDVTGTALVNFINGLYDHNDIVTHIYNKYDEYSFYNSSVNTASYNSAIGFHDEFMRKIKGLSTSSYMLLKAYYAEYNPIENYDLTENTYTGLKAGDTVNTIGDSNGVKTTTSESTMDGGVKITGSTTTDKYNTKTAINHDKTISYNGTTTDSYASITHMENRKHGNIGVMSVPDQIKKEMDLRFTNIIEQIIDGVCDDILIYVGD